MSSRAVLMIGKRLFDFIGACLLLILLSPLFAFIAVAIKLNLRGPVFFRQIRLGLDCKTFSIFKFRTMVPNAESFGAGLSTFEGDPRVTKVGCALRKYRLDELPQLINVILGRMSLVGPRPLLPEYLGAYSKKARKRMLMPPGMTGWQQVNGGAIHTWQERVEFDVWYVEHWTPWLDLAILLRTPSVILKADTVYGRDGWQRSGVPDTQLAREEAA